MYLSLVNCVLEAVPVVDIESVDSFEISVATV